MMAPFLNCFSHFSFVSHPEKMLMAISPELVLFFLPVALLVEDQLQYHLSMPTQVFEGCKLEMKLHEECVIKSC